MGTWQRIDFTNNEDIQSAYSPIKFTFRISGSPTDGQTGTVKDYVSMNVHITPYNMVTNQWLNGSSGTDPLPNETFSYRVPYTPYVHNFAVNSTPNDGTYRYFSTDLSSVLRGYLSYDLRPCSHDTDTNAINRDITMSQMCPNLLTYYQVRFDAEYIDANGNLARENANTYFYPIVLNAALTYEEEINGYFSSEHRDEDATALSGNNQLQGETLTNMFYHHPDNLKNYNRQNYLSVKPMSRNIGVDESEYVTFLNQRTSDSYLTEVRIHFFQADGTSIGNASGGNYGAIIDASVAGDGSFSGDGNFRHLLDWGIGTNTEVRHACQVGVGTRNIKEMGIEHPEIFNNEEPLTDWSNVAYYTVDTIYGANTTRKTGKTITYYVDHSRKTYGDTVRFHWQSRLGGIDSYTFDGSATRGIETSSSTFEQSIYPQFNAQLSPTSSGNNMWGGISTHIATQTDNTGAVVNRVAGLTDDKYPAIRKHQVDAYGNGTAVSRPIPLADREMMEDLMSSPNVWVERGWEAREVFKEDFSSYSSVSDISDNWLDVSGGDITTNAGFATNEGHITGTSCYQKGDNSGNDEVWLSSKKLFRYDPNKMYEVEIRLKDSALGSGTYYCGITGYAESSNGDYTGTKINNSGSNNYGSQHYITLAAYPATNLNKWRTYRGYLSGHIRNGGSYGGERNKNPMNHARAYTGVAWFAPMFILHFDSTAGISYVDYIKVTEYSPAEKTHEKFYSSLNKHYYVPVLLKDGGQTLYDSEGVSTVSVNYVESRKKRGIRN